ncbi:MAG: hypothetical protein V4710_03950 [Verrucomicrobiota bacterium]
MNWLSFLSARIAQGAKKEPGASDSQDQDNNQVKKAHGSEGKMQAGDYPEEERYKGSKRQKPSEEIACVEENHSNSEDQRNQNHSTGNMKVTRIVKPQSEAERVGYCDCLQYPIPSAAHHDQSDQERSNTATCSAGTSSYWPWNE